MSFDVLSRDLNVFAPHFLEASAGTGKTFAIEHLVTRLLLEGSAPLRIEEILVVTFTRAATRELKSRIRRNLMRVQQELIEENPSADYLLAICERGESAKAQAKERIDAALICFDAAQIYTLHGFCHRLLQEFAFEAGINFAVSDPDDKQYLAQLESMVKDHLKNAVAQPDYSPVQISAVLKQHQSKPRKLISALVALAASLNEIALIPSHDELLHSLLAELNTLPAIDANALKADLACLIPHFKQMTSAEIPAQIELLTEVVSSRQCTPVQFDKLLTPDFFLSKMNESQRKVRSKFPDSSQLHYPGLVDELRRKLLPLIEIARSPSHTLLRLGKELQLKSRELMEQRGAFSPDALLLKTQQALQSPQFVERVRKRFRAAIIDEFQDTDPIQWDIIRQLFLTKIDSICLVGDPKQSIYAFRNADVYVYLEAAQAMGEAARMQLDTNYRSIPSLVTALNLLFARANSHWMGLPASKKALEVLPVKAGVRESPPDTNAPVEFFIVADKRGRKGRLPTTETLEDAIFPYIAAEIADWHLEKKVAYHDIAVLIKDRNQGRLLIDYLTHCGIPASSVRSGLIVDTEAFFALKEILAAVYAPSNLSQLKAALGGPVFAWSEEMLGEEALWEAKALMQSLYKVLFEQGFGPFFQALLQGRCNPSHPPLVETLLSRGERELYLNLRKLAELLIEEELERGLPADGFLMLMDELAEYAHRDEARLRVVAQEEKGSVCVITTHMSKGLEFEVVFALGISSRHPASDQIAIKKKGRKVLTILDPADSSCKNAIEEQDAEKMRQLYVALTRAKRKLYISLAFDVEKKPIEIGEASPSELFFARIAEDCPDHAALYNAAASLDCDQAAHILNSLAPHMSYRILSKAPAPVIPTALRSKDPLMPPTPLPLPRYDEPLLSFSSLAKKDHPAVFVKPAINAPLSPHTLPPGAETGQFLHALFETIFKRKLHHPLNKKALSALIDEQIAFSPFETWQSIFLHWMIELLTQPLSGAGFSLADVPGEQIQQEFEFLYPMKYGKMKGFADLLFEYKGKYYLLDWKSNYLGPSDADYTVKAMAEAMRQNQYDLQASIYADALQRYVKLFDNRPFSSCFGGAIYYFVRGKGVYHFFPEIPMRD